MKYNKKIGLLLLIIIFSLTICGSKINSFKYYIDLGNLENINKITAKYKVQGKEATSYETITYTINHNVKNNSEPFITIKDIISGEFAQGYYVSNINKDFQPLHCISEYKSEYENTDYIEEYRYTTNNIFYTSKKNDKTKEYKINGLIADSITLMELLTFIDTDKIKKLEAKGLIVPGSIKIPFKLEFLQEENIIIEGKTYNCLKYKGELNNIFGGLVRAFGGTSYMWVMKEYPHIRVKAQYAKKEFTLIDYIIE